MKARHLIESSTHYGPEALAVIGRAFDEAWASIANHFDSNDAVQVSAARIRLAHAVLAVATEDCRDVAEVKNAALQVLAMTYRQHKGSQISN